MEAIEGMLSVIAFWAAAVAIIAGIEKLLQDGVVIRLMTKSSPVPDRLCEDARRYAFGRGFSSGGSDNVLTGYARQGGKTLAAAVAVAYIDGYFRARVDIWEAAKK